MEGHHPHPGAGEQQQQQRSLLRLVPVALLALAVALPAARALGLIGWSWGAVFAPFTVFGVLLAVAGSSMLLQPVLEAVRPFLPGGIGEAAPLTPAPDRLERPLGAAEAGERILAQHPELLAAVCHGLGFRKLLPKVLGRPVTDPWGVYDAAVQASAGELPELRMAAGLHMQRFTKSGWKAMGRRPSDSDALKNAVKAFQKCARKAEAGRIDVNCTFEHVTVMFAARAPSRDKHLRNVAPKVRTLLERQYPQLATASLADGSIVKYADWQKQATRDRSDLEHLRRENERLIRKMEELQTELAGARAAGDALRESIGTLREKARQEARAEQETVVGDLRSDMQVLRADHARELGRLQTENARALANAEALAAERDALEHALFSASQEADDAADAAAGPVAAGALAGLRVLLVGGREGQIPPIRQHLESYGVQLLHQDGPAATDSVAGVHTVVLWIRYVSHPTADAVKRECNVREVPCLYWPRTSPPSLLALLAKARSETPPPPPSARSGGDEPYLDA